jgi:hypothetical protein
VSTSVGGRDPSSHLPNPIGQTPVAFEHSFFGYFENYFLLSPNGQLANFASTSFITSASLNVRPAVAFASLVAFVKRPLQTASPQRT